MDLLSRGMKLSNGKGGAVKTYDLPANEVMARAGSAKVFSGCTLATWTRMQSLAIFLDLSQYECFLYCMVQ